MYFPYLIAQWLRKQCPPTTEAERDGYFFYACKRVLNWAHRKYVNKKAEQQSTLRGPKKKA